MTPHPRRRYKASGVEVPIVHALLPKIDVWIVKLSLNYVCVMSKTLNVDLST